MHSSLSSEGCISIELDKACEIKQLVEYTQNVLK